VNHALAKAETETVGYEDLSRANRAPEHPALARAGGIIEFGAFHALLPGH
jgi:hypothetical protein